MDTEILFGIHPIYEALKAGRRRFYEICITKEKPLSRIDEILNQADRLHIPVRRMSKSDLAKMTGSDTHQGICASVGTYRTAAISDMLSAPGNGHENLFLLMLDHIADPHNLGALIRTASCAGVNGMIIPKDRCAYPSPAVSKISAGALEHVLIAQVPNLVAIMKELKTKGFWIAGLDPAAQQTVFDADFSGHLAMVIGGEEKGIGPLIKSHCDFLISVPQKGKISSLNASVAGGVVMYEVFRQKQIGKRPSEYLNKVQSYDAKSKTNE